MTMTTKNYLGATIFWLYIAAALFFSGVVISTLQLSRRHDQPTVSAGQRRKKNVIVFSILAVVSFTVLSINMLTVLIQSYRSWSQLNRDILTGRIFFDIWTWSIVSTLFRDFGEAIVASAARYFWAQAALGVTLEVSLFMAFEGTSRGIPRLWSFFCLAQILPISFAQNLFYIAILFHPTATTYAELSNRSFFGSILAYAGCLIAAPYVAQSEKLIPLILVARILLFAPSVFMRRGKSATAIKGIRTSNWTLKVILLPLIIAQFFFAWREMGSLFGVATTLFEHPAVSALGCDFIISIVSALIWMTIGPVDYRVQEKSGRMNK